MRGQSFPLVVRAPPFPGGNLNQNLYQYCCRTDVPFIRQRYSTMTMIFGKQDLPPWTLRTVSCLNQPIFYQPAGYGYSFELLPFSSRGYLRNLFGHCRPTVEADGHPVMLAVEAYLFNVFVQVSPSVHPC